MHSRAIDRRSASKCQGQWPDQTLDQAFGLPAVLVAVSTSRLSCKRSGKTRTLIPVWDSSGESRYKMFNVCGSAVDMVAVTFPIRAGGVMLEWSAARLWPGFSGACVALALVIAC